MGEAFWHFVLDGLSGWIIFILTLLIGGVVVYRYVRRRHIHQSKLKAGGSIAGGNIYTNTNPHSNTQKTTEDSLRVVQENLEASGDIAGGDIIKRDK